MFYSERDVLRTELAMLEEMLEGMDPGRVIERAPLRERRDELAGLLEALSEESDVGARALHASSHNPTG